MGDRDAAVICGSDPGRSLCDVNPLETMSERQQIIKGPDIGIQKPERKPLRTKPRPAGPTPPKPPKKAPPGTTKP
jgi:hypothetical protein